MGRVRFFGGKGQAAVRIGDNPNLNDAEVISIGDLTPGGGGKTYEWDNNVSVTPGNILVTIGGDAPTSITNLMNAINNNKPTPGVTAFIDPKDNTVLRIEADDRGSLGNMALVTDMADPDNIISGAAFTGGESGLNQVIARADYTVTALDILAGNLMISSGLPTSPRFIQLDTRTAAGARKVIDSLVTVDGTRIKVDFQGGTDPVAGDVITVFSWE